MTRRRAPLLASLLVGGLAVAAGCATAPEAPPPEPPSPEYVKALEEHRQGREERLASDSGWLTLVGLFWLEEGEHAFGSDPQNPIAFPEGSSPLVAGRIRYDGNEVTLIPAEGVDITIDGESVGRRVLVDDNQDETDVVQVGRLKFHVIKRGDAHGLRVKDPESPVRTEFAGLDYFPIDTAFRVTGRFVAHAEPQAYAVPTVLGTPADMFVPGLVEINLGGKEIALTPLVSDPDDTNFFFIIKDDTSKDETYPAGRYLYADLVDGHVEIDFNKAYNPPCAFTSFATCPLPPRENWLDLAIRAGELKPGAH